MSLYVEVEERMKFMTNLIKRKEIEISNAPEGALIVHRKMDSKKVKSICRYYCNENGRRKYLKAGEEALVKQLGQKDYDLLVLQAAQEELAHLGKLYAFARSRNSPEEIYEALHPERRKIVTPIQLPDEEFVEQWQNKEYKKKGFRENMPELYTVKEERVRSKSEVLIANALARHNVPYRYEAPLNLEPYGIVYPDFTVLNICTRKEFYWEHFGKMDDADYCEKALEKILLYEKNGFFPGEKLIITHETLEHPINSRWIETVIIKYFK